MFIVIQLLIYVKGFEHTFILKYYRHFTYYLMLWFAIFFKVFKVFNVIKNQRRADCPSLINTGCKLSFREISFMELRQMLFIHL